MRRSIFLLHAFSMIVILSSKNINETRRGEKVLSLFSIVQFPNLECSTGDTTTPVGTCLASSECSAKGGSSTGNCAAGFGVCCVAQISTCGSQISTNTSYIRNPGYPSTFTPSNAGTCVYTINKASDDVCQLRLDFITMSGHLTGANGACTDSFAAAGQTGVNPPTICGTNSGYHMYVEFGNSNSDTVTLTNTWATGGLTTAKNYNILVRQICCNDNWRAPTNCVQYFTGITGSVFSYNHQGGQFLQAQNYQNCFRTEKGYCRIQWKQSSATNPDPFGVGDTQTEILSNLCPTLDGWISIPNLTSNPDGFTPIAVISGAGNTEEFHTQVCGNNFGVAGTTNPGALTSAKLPFIMDVFSTPGVAQTGASGFNMEYTQLPCN